MSEKEAVHHLERKFSHLKKHVTEQDAEIFKLSKLVKSLVKKVEKLENRMKESGMDSPIDTDVNPLEERPPHY